jgi:biopolymer transport protein ExbD
MELLSFDGKNLIMLLLLSFSGCLAIQPPPTTEIKTPRSVSTEVSKINDPHSLEIIGSKNGEIEIIYINEDSSKTILRNEKNLTDAIRKYKELAGGKDSLKVLISADATTNYKTFEKIIEALRKNEIYNYKLLTTPE